MSLLLLHKFRFLAPMGAGVLLLLSGCNQSQSPQQTAQVAPTPAATPRPTPTPDPLLALREAQQIPDWAKSRVLNEVTVKPGEKVFALTFDDGPWPDYTRQILAILREHKVKATFFMVGQMVQEYPKIAREVFLAGHAVGGHSWDHPSRPRNAVAQIQKTNAIIKKEMGFTPTTFRPPYGLLKNGMARQAMKEKQCVLIWSADSDDWRRPPASRMARTVINQATPGGIALMHDGGGTRTQTVAALPTIIRELKARGYRFVTIPELLKLRYIAPPKPKATPKPKTPAPKKP